MGYWDERCGVRWFYHGKLGVAWGATAGIVFGHLALVVLNVYLAIAVWSKLWWGVPAQLILVFLLGAIGHGDAPDKDGSEPDKPISPEDAARYLEREKAKEDRMAAAKIAKAQKKASRANAKALKKANKAQRKANRGK